MEETSRHSDQEQDLIYALDIGTRSVIGLLARQEQDKMRVLEVERRPHERRTMLDGQIEDIRQVAKVVSEVTKSLEERSGRKLERACVAAAGRALRTERGEYCLELSAPEIVKGERISQLELEAVAAAERTLQDMWMHFPYSSGRSSGSRPSSPKSRRKQSGTRGFFAPFMNGFQKAF